MADAEVIDLGLPDGRRLEVQVSGPADGIPLVWHHGTPGCAYQSAGKQRDCAERGLRLVSYSRAGAGGSTRNVGRSVADVAADIAAVLDHLGVDRCITGGQSGGGPHALATGALLPDRVAGVIVGCGVRPFDGDADGFLAGMGEANIEEFGLAQQGEALLRPFVMREREGIMAGTAAGVIEALSSLLPPIDRAALTNEVGADLIANLKGGATVPDGWIDDDFAFVRPWGFALEDIRVPVSFWQGSEDLMVPQSHMAWQAEQVPGAVMHLEEGEGHLSLMVANFGRMLDEACAHL
jgi:pimeloyl-ACP methyl ester carboxylesterase